MVQAVEADAEKWENAMYYDVENPAIGQRLGVSYLQSNLEYVDLKVNQNTIQLHQSSMGVMAIAGVVWDAGFCLSDYMIASKGVLGNVLDLGCGTGVCGLTAVLLDATRVTFTDIIEPPSLDDNLSQLSDELRSRTNFVAHDWNNIILSDNLISPSSSGVWDTVLCSDLLYDKKVHDSLLRLLQQLRMKKAIFAYKRRHDVPEREFYRKLSLFCNIEVVIPSSFELKNLSQSAISGLYLVIVVPKGS